MSLEPSGSVDCSWLRQRCVGESEPLARAPVLAQPSRQWVFPSLRVFARLPG